MAAKKTKNRNTKPVKGEAPRTILARRLKQTRLDRKLTIGKVSKELRVPEQTLKGLENPNDKSIPPSYLRGLAERYAEVLGLPPDEIPELVDNLESQPEATSPQAKPKTKQKRSPIVLSKISTFVVAVVVVGVIAGYALYQAYGLASAPSLSLEQPQSDTIVSDAILKVSGKVGTDSSVLVNGDPVPLGEGGSFGVDVYLQPGKNQLEVTAINNFDRQSTQERVIYYQPEN